MAGLKPKAAGTGRGMRCCSSKFILGCEEGQVVKEADGSAVAGREGGCPGNVADGWDGSGL